MSAISILDLTNQTSTSSTGVGFFLKRSVDEELWPGPFSISKLLARGQKVLRSTADALMAGDGHKVDRFHWKTSGVNFLQARKSDLKNSTHATSLVTIKLQIS